MCYVVLICLPARGHLGCFHLLAIGDIHVQMWTGLEILFLLEWNCWIIG